MVGPSGSVPQYVVEHVVVLGLGLELDVRTGPESKIGNELQTGRNKKT